MKRTLILMISLIWNVAAFAAPTINALTVQGYMKKSNGSAVTNGTYTLAYGVFVNNTAVWGKSVSTTVTNGLFSTSLSSNGSDLSSLGVGTGMNSNYSAVTLSAALIQAGGNGGIMVRIYAVSSIDAANPQFDVTINAVPTAMVAAIAQTVTSGGVTLSAIASSAYAATSAGAGDAGKLLALDGNGKIDSTFYANSSVPVAAINGTVPVASGGTGGTSAGTARSSIGAAASGANSDITSLTGLTTALGVAYGGTGATSASSALTSLGAAASGANSDITSLSGLTGTVSTSGNISQTGVTNLSTGTGAISLNGDVTVASGKNFAQNGAGTFGTGTGSVSINGDTTLASGKNFTQAGAGTFTTGTGAVSINGSLSIASGKTFTQSGSGTFDTGTGAVGLNGDVTVASGKNFSQTGTGTFGTGTGAVSLNGDVSIASGKNFSQSGAGTFGTGTGAISLNGSTTLATGLNYIVTPTSLALANGSNNDVAIGSGTFFRVTTATQGMMLTGMTGGSNGRQILLQNTIAKPLGLAIASSSSSAANRINGQGCILTQYGIASLIYDSSAANWLVTGCNIGSTPTKTLTSLAANTTWNSAGPLVTDGAEFINVPLGGNFTGTLQCIAIDTNNSITPPTGSRLSILFNSNVGGGAASQLTVGHNTACASPGYTVKNNFAASTAVGTAGNTPITAHLYFDGTQWQLMNYAP